MRKFPSLFCTPFITRESQTSLKQKLTQNKEIVVQISTSQIINSSALIRPSISNAHRYKPEGAIHKLFHSVAEPHWFKTVAMETEKHGNNM